MENLTSDQKNELVNAGVVMIRALDKVFSAEKAIEFWDKLADVIHPDFKGLTFSAMIGNPAATNIIVSGFASNIDKVSVIRELRYIDTRKLSLKEALDIYHKVEAGTPAEIHVFYDRYATSKNKLVHLGCVVS